MRVVTTTVEIDMGNVDWKALPPADKVAIIEAMGFTPGRDPHTSDCPAGMDSGFICQCVPDSTSWSAPQDVLVYRHETWDDRLADARKRKSND